MDRPLTPPPAVERDLVAPYQPVASTPSLRDGRDDSAHADREARGAVPTDAGSIEYASWFSVGHA